MTAAHRPDRSEQRLWVRLDEDTLAGPESGTPTQALARLEVPPALQAVVARVLAYHETFAPGVEVVEHVLPDGRLRVVVPLSDEEGAATPSAMVIGASTAAATVRLRGRMHGLSLELQPGAAAALLGAPASEFAGRAVPLEAVWGREAASLRERLAEAPGTAAQAKLLHAVLWQRWQHGQRRHGPGRADAQAVVSAALQFVQGGAGPGALRDRSDAGRLRWPLDAMPPLGEVAAALGMGERRLQQLFREHVGLSPRTWRRLVRLQRVVRALRARPAARGPRTGPDAPPPWAELAVAAGFYDQAHLANEFRALAGLTPGEFWSRAISGSSKTGG